MSPIEIVATSRELFEIYVIFIDIHFAGMDLHDTSTSCFSGVRQFYLTCKISSSSPAGTEQKTQILTI